MVAPVNGCWALETSLGSFVSHPLGLPRRFFGEIPRPESSRFWCDLSNRSMWTPYESTNQPQSIHRAQVSLGLVGNQTTFGGEPQSPPRFWKAGGGFFGGRHDHVAPAPWGRQEPARDSCLDSILGVEPRPDSLNKEREFPPKDNPCSLQLSGARHEAPGDFQGSLFLFSMRLPRISAFLNDKLWF